MFHKKYKNHHHHHHPPEKKTTLLSYGPKLLLAYSKATSQSYAKSKTIKKFHLLSTFCASGTCTWLKSILGFNQYSVTSILPTSI